MLVKVIAIKIEKEMLSNYHFSNKSIIVRFTIIVVVISFHPIFRNNGKILNEIAEILLHGSSIYRCAPNDIRSSSHFSSITTINNFRGWLQKYVIKKTYV